jgi:hypothetical protein
MLDHKKLSRIKELIDQKESVERELEQLLGIPGEAPKAKRGRPRKEEANGNGNQGTVEGGLPLGENSAPVRNGAGAPGGGGSAT